MDLIPVESSMLRAVGYDPTTRELEVVFTSGHVYRYRNVPEAAYKELLEAGSKGRYMRANIMGMYADYRVPGRR